MAVCLASARVAAQDARFLGKAEILLYGIALKVEPAEQTVPKDIATIVSTFLTAPAQVGDLPPFAPDAVVMATLRGPSLAKPLELTTAPNTPFNIPPLKVAGLHTLEDIRLVSNGQVLLRATPEAATINVIDKLLVTQVTARPLTAAEIREKGIVFDKSNFQAYNFTAAFALKDGPAVDINFPILLPAVQGASDVKPSVVSLPPVQVPALKTVSTIIPDTLKVQTQVPNLSVIGFTLQIPSVKGQDLIVPPIPGVIVIPGNIGFLDQYFSVLLMVSNAAPAGSNLVVSDLSASIVLPPGNDGVVGSGDDPLVMANTEKGVSPSVRPITQPGPDGQLGTADDITTIGPGESGNAEYLVEGRREGSHVVEMAISGTLNGLPAGPVAITGRAAGAVLVRNPTFSLTFVHPDTVVAGEPYTLDVTVTNTSNSPANLVSINLFPRNISGATLVGDFSKSIDSIAPGDAVNVSFDLISNVTGQVTAATLDADTNVSGRFELKHSVGELGIPLSPESLVLPAEARALPKSLRDAAVGLLGKAWAVATAPAGALPKDVLPFSRQVVLDMGVAEAEAGLRVSLREPLRDSVTQLAMDFFGSAFSRLPALNPKPDDLQFARDNYTGFDDLRRRSIRGDVFALAAASLVAPDFLAMGASAFHDHVARTIAYRPPHISVLLGTPGGAVPFSLSLLDSQQRQVGSVDDMGKVLKQIPFSDYLIFENSVGDTAGQMAFLVAPPPGDYSARLDPVPGVAPDTPFTLSVVVPRADGSLRHLVFENLTSHSAPQTPFVAGDPYRLTVSVGGQADQPVAPSTDAVIAVPPPSVIAVVQKADADILPCVVLQAGRVISVLFSSEVTPASAQDKFNAADITNYVIDGNKVVSVALQPGGRIALLALRDPIGPLVPRTITISGVADVAGRVMDPQTLPIVSTVTDAGSVVSGRVLQADGTAIPFASVKLFTYSGCEDSPWAGISSKTADALGNFSWDFVLRDLERIVATDPASGEFRDVQFNVQRDGQRVNIDVVLLGRGAIRGRTLDENGRPLQASSIRVTSLTDQSQYGATSAADGSFTIAQVPVGNVLIEAVNTRVNAKTFASDIIPFANATTTRDLTLFATSKTQVMAQHGNLSGHVLTDDGATAVSGVPVVVYYSSQSQPGVICPAGAAECAVAIANTDDQGAFSFAGLVAGSLRIHTIDQPTFQEGEAKLQLAADGSATANILLAAGLGTVHGTVLDALGKPVADARVGGGLSLAMSDAVGAFTLTDVPVGHVTIIAVSDALHSKGSAEVDVVRAGEEMNVTIVVAASGGVAGTVRQFDGTPAAGIKTYLFNERLGSVTVVGTTVTDDQGQYSFSQVPLDDYSVSAFRSDFSDGNVAHASVRFANEVARADVTFRGGGGQVTGTVFDADGHTPLAAKVGISGDQPVIAGGQVAIGFQHVANFAIADTSITTGMFTLSGLWVGPFTLNAVGQFSPDPVALENVMPSPAATVHMDIRLQPTSTITGVVLQPDGVTPVGANVVVKYKSDEYRSICSQGIDGDPICTSIPQGIQEEVAVTDAQGRFSLPIVNAGTFTITAEDQSSGKSGQIHGAVKAGETADLFVRLSGVATIAVQVLGSDAQTPIPGAKVVVTQLDYPKKSLTRFADTQGSLTLAGADGFSEGQFVVVATDVRNGFTGRASGRVDTDGQTVAVRVFLFNQTGTVHGTVFKSDGLTPVSNAEVVLSGGASQLPLAFALTASDGSYSMDQIPLGAFSLEAFEAATARRGFANSRVDLDRQDVAVDITETALGVVRGTALDAKTLDVLKGWTVRLNQVLPSGRGVALLGMTSVDGTFSFPGVSKGAVTLFASKQSIAGTGQGTGAITREGQVVDVPILVSIIRPLVGTIAGRVFNPDGSPAPNSQVEVGAVTLTADAAGAFTIQQPLGRYLIRAHAQTNANAGSELVQLSNDGETVGVTVTMAGLSRIDGHVQHSDGSPAPNVQLQLQGYPTAGCATFNGSCTGFTNANGDFSFINLPARSFTVSATEAITGLRGAVGDTVDPGATKSVTIVLQPSGSLTGRALLQNGSPASGIVAELIVGGRTLFVPTGDDGRFTFGAVPLLPFSLELDDPLRGGIAKRASTIGGAVDLGDVPLDETPPAVASVTPTGASTGVPLNQVIHVVFTEKVDASTVNATNITVSDGSGAIPGTLLLESGDASALFTPVATLKEFTRYTIRVKGLKDLVGKVMASDFVSTFTTVDLTPPAFAEISPAQNSSGVTASTTIRMKFSEPIDPTKFVGAPVLLTSGGAAVAGRTDYLFGNTVLVFTPTLPLNAGAIYRVQIGRAVDLAGNVQATALDFQFSTTDNTPPQLARLIAPPTVVENGTASVVADAGSSFDIAVVDFFINGTPVAAARTAPFTLTFQAIPSFGKPGDQIRISAFATDTSGNRATIETATTMLVTPDQPPIATITAPASGVTAKNGDLITVTVRATDDLGVTKEGYKAQTGKPQDASLVTLGQPSLDHTETFSFHVPADAGPGSTIVIEASALDSKGQVGQAAPVSVTVLDAVPPVVSITGASTGQTVRPGQTTSVVVSAQDLGGVSTISFSASGAAVFSDSRPLDGAPANALVSFSVQVPANAVPGQNVTLNATAVDKAGNIGTAATIDLPVADTVPPTVALRTDAGATFIVPSRAFTVIADASDGIGVARVELTGSGAFTVSDVKQVAPPTGDAHVPFTINVPANTLAGAVLNLQARAFDTSNNVSTTAFLSLTVKTLIDVVLPPSVVVPAGQSIDVQVQVPGGGPATGQFVTFTTTNAGIATVTPSLVFGAGETSKPITIAGQSGGSVTISALVQGVERASMTVTVQGGVVDGTVFDPTFTPVAGAVVTVTGQNNQNVSSTTGGDGRYSVAGVSGPAISVHALASSGTLRGFTTATMNAASGFAHVNVVLMPAGAIHGTVHLADATTPAPAGVKIDLFLSSQPFSSLATTFTDAVGAFEFPVVNAGTYTIDGTATDGNRGRTTTTVLTGVDATADIAYLGRGSVFGTIADAGGVAVPNANLTFRNTSIFGTVAVSQNATASGTYRFDDVFVGTFDLTARDPVTNRAAAGSGTIATNGQQVLLNLSLAPFATVQGTVRRSDGTTTVPNATVSMSGVGSTKTDAQGFYQFPIVPLGSNSVVVNDAATRGLGRTDVTLATNGQTVTADVQLLGQGSVVATVVDSNAAAVSGASVTIAAVNGSLSDTLVGTTGANGTAVIDHVLAGQLTINATKAGLNAAPVVRALSPGEVAPVTLTLQATASIAGTVFAPDGQTPQSTGRVDLFSGSTFLVQSALAAGGAYHFDGVKLGAYTLQAVDTLNHLRATASVTLTDNGQVVTKNLTFVGQGNVVGRVLNPNGSGAPSLQVQVVSADPTYGRTGFATTDAAGNYEVDNLALGTITASVSDVAHGQLGLATGTLATNGQVLTLNVLLQSNAFNFPITLLDANTFQFDLRADGAIGAGKSVFNPVNLPRTGAALSVVSNGVTTAFTGNTIGTKEDQGREVAARQTNVAGLNITRKIFVPSTGYFARYLEIVANPTQAPITVDLQITTGIVVPVSPGLNFLSTSSGDAVLDISDPANPDRWAVVDDTDFDPFLSSNNPSLAFTFDGAGAARRVGIATFSPNNGAGTGVMKYGWTSVTVPAGATVAFMHFVTQEVSRAGAIAAAQRLSQLPPEALSGLAADEIAQISNFVVPPDGSSPVPALPALSGSVTGTLYQYDGTTPVTTAGGSNVIFKSNDPLFGRTFKASSDASGHFTLNSNLNGTSTQVVIPIENFTISANYPLDTQLVSPAFAGAFNVGETVAVQNVVFTNAGAISGFVRRQNGQALTNGTGTVTASGIGMSSRTASIGADGSFLLRGIAEGSKTLSATINNPQGSALVTTASTTAHAGQIVTQDLTIGPTGAVAGVVRTGGGSLASGVTVNLSGSGVSRSTVTSGTGTYTLSDVPAGTYTLSAIEPNSQVPTIIALVVPQDQTTPLDFILVGLGTVSLQVNYTNGAATTGATVQINIPSVNQTFKTVGTTDGTGHLNVPNVPAVSYDLRVLNPTNAGVFTDSFASITSNGQVVPLAVSMPFAGTITGTVKFATGTVAAGTTVQVIQNGIVKSSVQAGSGVYTFSAVGTPPNATIRAFNPQQTNQFKDATNLSFSVNSQTLTANITLPAQATLRVTSLIIGARVEVKSAFDTDFVPKGSIDSTGTLLIPNVPEGTDIVRLVDAATSVGIGAIFVTVGPGDQGRTIDVPFTFVPLPVNLTDANGMLSDIQRGGNLLTGSNSAFHNGGLGLTVGAATGSSFSGATWGMFEDNNREIGITQNGLGGNQLSVTRKIFVPADGYFTRYLEILTNTTAAPINANATIFSTSDSSGVLSSAGGNSLSPLARWFVTDDDDGTQTSPPTRPAVAFVLEGAGAAVSPGTAFYSKSQTNASPFVSYSMTIPAGQSAIIMHFVAQQPQQAGAIAAAQRLAQLPPEAMAGLSAAERANIVNWVVPADGVGTVPPLPARTGVVTGRLLTGDGQTVLPSVPVKLTSPNEPMFAAKTATTAANGTFTFNGVTVDTFTLTASDPITHVTATTSANFPTGQTTATQDLIFGDTGVVRGNVTRLGAPVVGATVTVVAGPASATVVTQAGGAYLISGLPAGTYTIEATAAGAAGGAVVQVINGQSTTANITIGVGSIVGKVVRASGAAAAGASVQLIDPLGVFGGAQTTANTNGDFQFNAVTVGASYIVKATHPTNPYAVVSSTPVETGEGQAAQVNLMLPPSASAHVTVFDADGMTPLSALVAIDRHDGQGFQPAGSTNATSAATIPNVTGQFSVQAYSPVGVLGVTDGVVTPADDNGIVNLSIVTPGGLARVTGTVYAVDGITPLPDGSVTIQLVDQSGHVLQQSTDARYSFDVRVTTGNGIVFSLTATPSFDQTNVYSLGYGFNLSPGDEVSNADFTLTVPVVSGTVTFFDGTPAPFPNAMVISTDSSGTTQAFFATRTDMDGQYGVPVLSLGTFYLTAQDAGFGLTTTVSDFIATSADVITEDVELPQAVTLTGTVKWQNINLGVPGVQVSLTSAAAVSRTMVTNSNGNFSFNLVAASTPYSIVACDPVTQACGSAIGVATASNVFILITPPQPLTGTVLDNSFQPAAGASVAAYSANSAVVLTGVTATTASDGSFGLNAPAGTLNLTAFGAGSQIGTVQSVPGGSVVQLTLSSSNAIRFDYPVGRPSTRVLHCDGTIDGGPTSTTAFTTSTLQLLPSLGVTPLDTFPCVPYGKLQTFSPLYPTLDGGYRPGAGLQVSRQIYVSNTGVFTRYLEALTNPTTVPITVVVQINGSIAGGNFSLTRSPSQTGNTYAVVNDGSAGLGLVFAGSGGSVSISPNFSGGSPTYSYSWRVLLQPGQTRRLMHFVVQSTSDGSTTAAINEASGLATLSISEATAGMSTAEKSSVANFHIP